MSRTEELPDDGLGVGVARTRDRRPLLVVVAVAETVTLAALLLNLATVDDRTLAAVVGPLHGLLYLAGVLITWSSPFRTLAKVLAVLPVLGAWFAVGQRRARGPAAGPSHQQEAR